MDWMRPVFQRTRTQPPTPTAEDGFPSSSATDDSNEGEDDSLRMRAPSRVSSFMGSFSLDSPFSSNSASNLMDRAPAQQQPWEDIPLFKPDDTWVQPSADHMVESLKCIMMRHPTLKPLPVAYNSSILHVLEAYYDLKEVVKKKNAVITTLEEQMHINEVEFETMANVWTVKENQYKGEIKRIELELSKKEGGLENVAMARSGSVVHGTRRAAHIFKERLDAARQRNRLSLSSETGISEDTGETGTDLRYRRTQQRSSDKDREASARWLPVEATESRKQTARKNIPEQPRRNNRERNRKTHKYLPQIMTVSQSEAERYNEEHMNHSSDDDSTTDDESVASFITKDLASHLGVNIGNAASALGNPTIHKGKQMVLERYLSPVGEMEKPSITQVIPSPPRQMSFSYLPGDDTGVLSPSLGSDERCQTQKQTLDRSTLDEAADERPPFLRIPTKSAPAPAMPDLALRTYPPNKQIKRGDSSNSVLTAIRDNSGRSSHNTSPINARPNLRSPASGSKVSSPVHQRPQLRSGSSSNGSGSGHGSSEAITAAARALAASKAKEKSRLGSDGSYGDRESVAGGHRMVRMRSSMASEGSTANHYEGRSRHG